MSRLGSHAALALALSLPLSAVSAPVPTERDARLAEMVRELERLRVLHDLPGLAIAVVADDRVVLAQGLGLADRERGRPATPRTVFAIGSSTKAFTSALAAMAVDERRIGWDDPLSWYVPELDLQPLSDDPRAAVTIRDALSHRSGFARMGLLWAGGRATPELMYRTASGAEPVAPFREAFQYNNVVFSAAGDAVARASGRHYDVLLRRRLLGPLGMRNATVAAGAAAHDDHLAVGYAPKGESADFRALPMRDLKLVQPAGAINATVLDVARWVRFQLARGEIDGRRLVSAANLEETWKPQIEIGGGQAYGLGWFIREHGGRRVIEHGGNIDGFAAQVTLFPDEGIGYALLMNTTASPLQQLSVGVVADALFGEASSPPAGAGPDLSALTGAYLANFGPFRDASFDVSATEGRLHVNVPGQMNFELKPPDEEGKWYFALTDQIAVSFERGADGAVTGMKMYQSGMTFELPREGVAREEPAQAIPAEWNPLLGSYRSPSLKVDLTVLARNGNLALDVPGQMVYELNPPEDGRWSFRVSDRIQVAFERDEAGRVTALTQYRDGKRVESSPRVAGAKAGAGAGGADDGLEKVLALLRLDERREALKRLGGVRLGGTLRLLSSGVTGHSEWWIDGVERFRNVNDLSPFAVVTMVVNGDRAVADSDVDVRRELEGRLLRQARIGHPLSLFSDWRLFFDDILYREASELDGVPTHVVALTAEGLQPHVVHVDQRNGDILRVDSVELLPGGVGSLPATVLFSDHQDLGGLRFPRGMRASNDANGTTVVKFTSVEAGRDFPPGTFSMN